MWKVVKGSLPIFPTTSPAPYPGTFLSGGSLGQLFDGYLGLAPSFQYNLRGNVQFVTTAGGTRPASMYEVLASTKSNTEFVFAQEVIAAILNALKAGAGFPVTAAKVVAMYNATFNGVGTYPVNGTTNWTRSQVMTYLKSLHP